MILTGCQIWLAQGVISQTCWLPYFCSMMHQALHSDDVSEQKLHLHRSVLVPLRLWWRKWHSLGVKPPVALRMNEILSKDKERYKRVRDAIDRMDMEDHRIPRSPSGHHRGTQPPRGVGAVNYHVQDTPRFFRREERRGNSKNGHPNHWIGPQGHRRSSSCNGDTDDGDWQCSSARITERRKVRNRYHNVQICSRRGGVRCDVLVRTPAGQGHHAVSRRSDGSDVPQRH